MLRNMSLDTRRRVNGQYKIDRQIGVGGYSKVYAGYDRQGRPVAIKAETRGFSKLEYESRVYDDLNKRRRDGSRAQGVPRYFFYGVHSGTKVLVIQRLGKNLLYRLIQKGRNLSIKTVMMIGIQTIQRLKHIHSLGYVHRDISPDNLVTGIHEPECRTVFVIDFGLATRYKSRSSGVHIPRRHENWFVGKYCFSSYHSQERTTLSRRDDMESLVYTMVYLSSGTLPWENVPFSTPDDLERIGRMKREITATELCSGLPTQMKDFVRHIRSLSYEQAPNYTGLQTLLQEVLSQHHHTNNGKFDWL